jgi:hypothetical protein
MVACIRHDALAPALMSLSKGGITYQPWFDKLTTGLELALSDLESLQ